MEQIKFIEDIWRNAILAERNYPPHKTLINCLNKIDQQIEKALVLGDASMVNVKYLIEEVGVNQVVDVDSSPTLLDEVYFKKDDIRLKRIVKPFDEFKMPKDAFDFIYGKSISFNKRVRNDMLLKRINKALTTNGIFLAVWLGKNSTIISLNVPNTVK